MGYSHIPQKYAKPINAFYEGVFNSWLNLHRPCLFSTEVVSEKGKIIKRYKHKDVKTPLECLVHLYEKGLVTFKAGIQLEDLLAKARQKTDLEAAQEMQKAKAELFVWPPERTCMNSAGLNVRFLPGPSSSKHRL